MKKNKIKISNNRILYKLSFAYVSMLQVCLTIKNCARQKGDKCTECYRGHLNSYGTCTPFKGGNGCLLSSSSDPRNCNKCDKGWSKKGRGCERGGSGPTNCLNTYSYNDRHGKHFGCVSCLLSVPSKKRTVCEYFGDKEQFKNCLVGDNSQYCSICFNKFSLDLAQKRCVSAPVQGCWEVQNGACVSCPAWDGFYTDRQNGKITCTRHVDHGSLMEQVSVKENTAKQSIYNRTRATVVPDPGSNLKIVNYADFKDGYVVMNGTATNYLVGRSGSTALSTLNLDLSGGKKPPYYTQFNKYTAKERTFDFLNCFFFKKLCLVLNDTNFFDTETNSRPHSQDIFMLDIDTPTSSRTIFSNTQARDGKFISNFLPITKTSTVIVGFTTTKDWLRENTNILSRFDYLDQSKQFNYNILRQTRVIKCYQLLYIESTAYFAASFTNNGVLVYDHTKTTEASKSPIRIYNSGYKIYHTMAYLEKSRVLLVASEDVRNLIEGYSFTGNKTYTIRTNPPVYRLIAFKSSDFFVVLSKKDARHLYFYNLQGMIHHEKIHIDINPASFKYSEFFGNLLSFDTNSLIRLELSTKTANPSCLPSASQSPRYSFSNHWCQNNCSSEATFTDRGSCQLQMNFQLNEIILDNTYVEGDNTAEPWKGEKEKVIRGKSEQFWRLVLFIIIFGGIACVSCCCLAGCMAGIVFCCIACNEHKKNKKKSNAGQDKHKPQPKPQKKKEEKAPEDRIAFQNVQNNPIPLPVPYDPFKKPDHRSKQKQNPRSKNMEMREGGWDKKSKDPRAKMQKKEDPRKKKAKEDPKAKKKAKKKEEFISRDEEGSIFEWESRNMKKKPESKEAKMKDIKVKQKPSEHKKEQEEEEEPNIRKEDTMKQLENLGFFKGEIGDALVPPVLRDEEERNDPEKEDLEIKGIDVKSQFSSIDESKSD